MRILVVQNISLEGPGLLGPAMENAGLRPDIRVMDEPGAELPRSLDGYGALVILGGPMNVYEEEAYPYLLRVDSLIKEAIRGEMPVLGICLGGQLIAKALGAPVTRNPVPEIGWYPLRLTKEGEDSALFAGLPESFHVFQWHGDTFAVPAGARLLATGETCLNQAFSVENRLFALQFHLEVTAEMVGDWAIAYAGELAEFGGEGMAARLVAETAARREEYTGLAGKFLRNWINILRIKESS